MRIERKGVKDGERKGGREIPENKQLTGKGYGESGEQMGYEDEIERKKEKING